MSVNAIGAGYQNQVKYPTAIVGQEKQIPGNPSEVSKLNGEIEQAETEIKETMKEMQKAVAESIDGTSQKAQMLQSKILMQQQEIITKQLQIKEIESPKDSTTERESSSIAARPKFDQYVAQGQEAKTSDNVYRLEEKDGKRQIVFNP